MCVWEQTPGKIKVSDRQRTNTAGDLESGDSLISHCLALAVSKARHSNRRLARLLWHWSTFPLHAA